MSKLQNEKYTKRNATIRACELELVPYGNTQETIEKRGYIEQDKAKLAFIKELRGFFNQYISCAISDVLSTISYDYNIIYDLRIDKKAYGNHMDRLEKTIANEISRYINAESSRYPVPLKKASFYLEIMPNYLDSINEHEKAQILRNMHGSIPLFRNMITSLQNVLNIWVPRRVCENLQIYFDNLPIFIRQKEENTPFYRENKNNWDLFTDPNGYNCCISSQGINTYNLLISGIYDCEGNKIVTGYNEFANMENNRIKTEQKDEIRYRKAKQLYKQVLVPREKAFKINKISSNGELLETLFADIESSVPTVSNTQEFFSKIDQYLNGVFVKGSDLSFLSHILYNDHQLLVDKIYDKMMVDIISSKQTPVKKQKAVDAINININKSIYSLAEIEEYVNEPISNSLTEYCNKLYNKVIQAKGNIERSDIKTGEKVRVNAVYRRLIVNFTTSVTAVRKFICCFTASNEEELSEYTEVLNDLKLALNINYKATNLMRNYLTKKLKDDTVNIPLCFGTPAKYNGKWYSRSYNEKLSKDRYTIIRMDHKYYLFMLCDDTKPVLLKQVTDNYVELYSVAKSIDAMMNVPKTAFPKDVKKAFLEGADKFTLVKNMKSPVNVTRDIYEIYNGKLFTSAKLKDGTITQEQYALNLYKILSYYREVILNSIAYSYYDLEEIKNTDISKYKSSDQFFSAINAVSIKMEFLHIDRKQVENLVANGNALMFLITNRNMYMEGRTKTDYAKLLLALFSPENMKHTDLVLNASPTIYFRPKLFEPRIAHKKGSQLVNKTTVDGEFIPPHIRRELYLYFNHLTDTLSKEATAYKEKAVHFPATMDITYRRRYTYDKYIFSFTIKQGKSIVEDTSRQITDDINSNKEIKNILSIVRSTEDLLYYVLLDADGKVIQRGSLNVLGNVDYRDKLLSISSKKYSEKIYDWIQDSSAADIKNAYIKMAVSKISQIAIENDALILLDKISDTKRKTMYHLDNQVFAKFEDALVQKLNRYVIKSCREPKSPGSILNPLQLAYKSTADQKGLVITQSQYLTENLDAKTGFVNVFKLPNVTASAKAKFLQNFDAITIYEEYINFTFDYEKFDTSLKLPQTKWTIISKGEKTLYDNGSSNKIYYVENIAIYAKQLLDVEQIPYMLGKPLDISILSSKIISFIYNVFLNTLYGKVHKCDNVIKSYYVSPVTGETKNKSYDTAILNYKKYMFLLGYDWSDSEKNFAHDWLISLKK